MESFSPCFLLQCSAKSKVIHLIEGCSEIDRHNLTSRTGAREREREWQGSWVRAADSECCWLLYSLLKMVSLHVTRFLIGNKQEQVRRCFIQPDKTPHLQTPLFVLMSPTNRSTKYRSRKKSISKVIKINQIIWQSLHYEITPSLANSDDCPICQKSCSSINNNLPFFLS